MSLSTSRANGSSGGCSIGKTVPFPFLRWLPTVNRKTFRQDLLAGLTGAIIVLPQGVAFAAIAGLPPQYGLYTAMIPAIVAALFGSSLHLISGPTTAISIVVFATLSPLAEPGSDLYIKLAFTVAVMTGLFQLAMGLARLGTLINFVSHAVVVGFTAGAGVLIAVSQLKHLLGLYVPSGTGVVDTLTILAEEIGDTDLRVLTVGLATMITAIAVRRYLPRWPDLLTALVVGSLVTLALDGEHHGIPLVGAIPATLPPLSSPVWNAEVWRQLASSALAVALLGLIEAVSIARSVATHSHQNINGNQEFIGQGLSNIVGGFLSCYSASGSFTRSGVNFRAGAKTPLAAIAAALWLMLIVLLVAPLAAHLPIPAMAGAILLVAWKLIDFHHIRLFYRASRAELGVLVVTCLATLLVELEFAIYIGVLLSLALFLRRAAAPRITCKAPYLKGPSRYLVNTTPETPECPQLRIVAIQGPLFFGAVSYVEESLHCLDQQGHKQPHMLLVSSGINFIDVSGSELLVRESLRRRARGGGLYLMDVKDPVCTMFRRSGAIEEIGKNRVYPSTFLAIRNILLDHLDHSICQQCPLTVFRECDEVRVAPTDGGEEEDGEANAGSVAAPEGANVPAEENSSA